jgi:hypothetical protein
MTLGRFDVARDMLGSFGEIVRFASKVMGDIFRLRVFRYFGETLRQASILVPLTDFSPRKNEALERGYLRGRYGGVPFISSLRH